MRLDKATDNQYDVDMEIVELEIELFQVHNRN